jgi:hypothetical protein
MTRRKAMTLNEHIDLMKAEGSYNSFVAMRERQEDQREKHAAEYKSSEVPLMKALHGAGINVDSVWTLVNQSKPYPIDELIELVKDPSNGRARVLLLRGLRRSKQPQAKQAIEAVAFDPDLAVEIASWRKRKTKTDH